MQKRTVVAFTAIIVLLGGIMLRIYELTGPRLSQAAKQQARLTVTVASLRGTIYDCRLNPLVNHKTEYRVAVLPTKAIAATFGVHGRKPAKQVVERLKAGSRWSQRWILFRRPPTVLMFETPVRFKGKLPAPTWLGTSTERG